jgi:hypothetical protein
MKKKNSKQRVEVESEEAKAAREAKEAAAKLAKFYADYPYRRPGIHKRQVDGGKVQPGLDRSCYLNKGIKTFKTEVWQDGSKVDSFTGILQDKAADEFIKLLEAGATKAAATRCRADGATLTRKDVVSGRVQIPTAFTPCKFP